MYKWYQNVSNNNIKINSCVIPNSLEDFGELLAICPGTLGNLISHLHLNPSEPYLPSAPEPSGTLSTICTATLRNAICTGTFRNLISHLHWKAPEPSGTCSGTWCCSCIGSHQSYSGLKTQNRKFCCWGKKKISFGGIPNSSSLMPCLTTWAHSCSAVVLPMWTMSSPKGVQKQSHGCSCQGCKATNHPPNLPEVASGTYTGTQRNRPEPSGTCLQNLHQQTPELSGTLRNSPEPASGTYTSTHRNSPEPSSGTCSFDPHRHTPELIWAEDPISLRSWGKTIQFFHPEQIFEVLNREQQIASSPCLPAGLQPQLRWNPKRSWPQDVASPGERYTAAWNCSNCSVN